MNTTSPKTEDELQANADPLTGEAGAHPVATGIGAAALGTAGLMASAAVAGPIGVAAAVVGGAFIGGYAGKAAGELIDPTAEAAFWQEQHPRQPYAPSPRADDDDYYAAYRVGYVGYALLDGHRRSFDEAEAELRTAFEATGARLPWTSARQAALAAWERVHRGEAHRSSTSPAAEHTFQETILRENL